MGLGFSPPSCMKAIHRSHSQIETRSKEPASNTLAGSMRWSAMRHLGFDRRFGGMVFDDSSLRFNLRICVSSPLLPESSRSSFVHRLTARMARAAIRLLVCTTSTLVVFGTLILPLAPHCIPRWILSPSNAGTCQLTMVNTPPGRCYCNMTRRSDRALRAVTLMLGRLAERCSY